MLCVTSFGLTVISKPRKFRTTLLFISGRTMEILLHVKLNIVHLVTDIAYHANARNFDCSGDFAGTRSTKPNPKALRITNKNPHAKKQP